MKWTDRQELCSRSNATSSAALPGVLLLLSGCCALVYQVTWLRELRLVFGASTAANAAVLAIFMGGLGLGGLLLGPHIDRHSHPLALYGKLELGVALSAAISPFLIQGVRAAYLALGGTPVMGAGVGTGVRLVLSMAVLGIPTFLMGGTLPAVVRAVERDLGRAKMGLLYALNTLGSVVGALLATFVAIEALGIRNTLWAAVGLNLCVAAVAWVIGQRLPPRQPDPPGTPDEAQAPPWGILAAAGVTGFAFLLMEICWYRLLAPLLGGSSYSFGMILAVALLGIGVGSLAYSAWARDRRPTVLSFGLTAALEAILLCAPLALGDPFALWAARIQPAANGAFPALVGVWFTIAAAAILPGALVAGFQFPLLVALLGKGGRSVGRHIGQAYAANTLGSILGSIAGGFGLLPLLGAVGVWRLVILLVATLAGVAAIAGRRQRIQALWVGLATALALGLASRPGPTAVWRHSPIGAGRSDFAALTGVALEDRLQQVRRSTLWEADGVESAIALQSLDGYAFVIHGKVDGHVIGDAATNLWLGLLPTLLHPDPARLLIVGLGTGQTAGWAASVEAVQAVDIIELEPSIARVARACAISSRAPLDNPKVFLHFGDAREWLLTTREAYDIIVSEPSNPYRAGIAGLFSVEFYRAVEERLGDDGIFLQWIQAYELSAETLATAFATLLQVFPAAEVWEGASGGDLLVMASRQPLAFDGDRLAHAVEQEPWRTALAVGLRVDGLAGLLAGYVGGNGLVRAVAAGAAINTDDHPVIEFGFAKHVGQGLKPVVNGLRQRAYEGGWDSPSLEQPPSRSAVLEARHTKAVASANPPGVPAGVEGAMARRMAARVAWVEGDWAQAASAWDGQDHPPTSPLDLLVMGETWAALADPRALDMATGLRPIHPTEALLVTARFQEATGDTPSAVKTLGAALGEAKRDPWVHTRTLTRGLELAKSLPSLSGPLGPAAAAFLLQPTLTPFAEGIQDEQRRAAALALAQEAGFGQWCRPAFATMEPYPPFHGQLLQDRAWCYVQANDPRMGQAADDLRRYQRLSGDKDPR